MVRGDGTSTGHYRQLRRMVGSGDGLFARLVRSPGIGLGLGRTTCDFGEETSSAEVGVV